MVKAVVTGAGELRGGARSRPRSSTPTTSRCSRTSSSPRSSRRCASRRSCAAERMGARHRRARPRWPRRPARLVARLASPYEGPVQTLIDELGRLPGIGPKSAQRIAFYLLKAAPEDANRLAGRDHRGEGSRDRGAAGASTSPTARAALRRTAATSGATPTLLCVVEEPRDIVAVERTHEFRGRYHVLQGAISPIEGIGPEQLRVKELLTRVERGGRQGGDPRDEPEHRGRGDRDVPRPAAQAARRSRSRRIASGLPVGGDLEYADEVTLGRAFEGRRRVDELDDAGTSDRARPAREPIVTAVRASREGAGDDLADGLGLDEEAVVAGDRLDHLDARARREQRRELVLQPERVEPVRRDAGDRDVAVDARAARRRCRRGRGRRRGGSSPRSARRRCSRRSARRASRRGTRGTTPPRSDRRRAGPRRPGARARSAARARARTGSSPVRCRARSTARGADRRRAARRSSRRRGSAGSARIARTCSEQSAISSAVALRAARDDHRDADALGERRPPTRARACRPSTRRRRAAQRSMPSAVGERGLDHDLVADRDGREPRPVRAAVGRRSTRGRSFPGTRRARSGTHEEPVGVDRRAGSDLVPPPPGLDVARARPARPRGCRR